MDVINSNENDIVTCNEVMVQNEYPSTEDSSNVTSSNNDDDVTKHPEQIKTKECLVQRRFSLRLQNRKDNGKDNKKRSMSDNNGNNFDPKRAKIEVGETCISDTSSPSSDFLHVFDELDFRGVLMIKESLRSFNLHRLESSQVEQSKSKKLDKRDAKLLRTKDVDKNWAEKGFPTSTGCKYLLKQLRRLAKLGNDKVVHLTRGQVSSASEYPCLVCKDLSNGQEAITIPVTNEYDDPPIAPEGFAYTTSLQYASNVKVPSSDKDCKCKGSCRNMSTCSCALRNGSEFPYVVGRKGCRLMQPTDILYECGPRCGPNCDNKITQKGLSYKLEVYRTPNKGWAVRTWDFIPCGAPICEYFGVVRRNEDLELESALGNAFIFDIDCLHTINEVDGRERRLRDVSLPSNTFVEKRNEVTTENEPEFSIDANSFGNVVRLINHSCDPNLFVQCVLSSHHDIRLARIVLFAAQDIPPYQELTYDYGYILDSVVGPDGIPKQLPCYCGAADCRKRLY
ncbi:histone-lysine N-methyltransferase, H3 lysine-9 specific SUVH4-like [Gastrolobium bilobum]|uniref:histone-lysine N-methyltransferase, H3 lysine-9 specific SUVH4-like n=1 Tax=Gastrolobium bilobum TaxID=150636 RepID=UPI002AB0FF95|nr:histone-lysine N-methyltransferase, H3 lysine-9 specific SUVH4-like [Gastrolobium bilobum]